MAPPAFPHGGHPVRPRGPPRRLKGFKDESDASKRIDTARIAGPTPGIGRTGAAVGGTRAHADHARHARRLRAARRHADGDPRLRDPGHQRARRRDPGTGRSHARAPRPRARRGGHQRGRLPLLAPAGQRGHRRHHHRPHRSGLRGLPRRHEGRHRHRLDELRRPGRHGDLPLPGGGRRRRCRGRRHRGDAVGAAESRHPAAQARRRGHAGGRGLHLLGQRHVGRRRRRRRAVRVHRQVGPVQLEGRQPGRVHRQRLRRRVRAGRHAALAHRHGRQHPGRRALHAVPRLRLRR